MTKDIIEPVQDESTDWVSGLVVAPKHNNPSEVRVCGDYRQTNKAIKRERHPVPTVDELLQDMSGAVKFSKVDLEAGYHQILLDQESRSITTFITHRGLFRYKLLPFGINAASEVFQNAIQNALQGLDGTRNIADDIIVWGSTDEEHDERLNALFARLSTKGLTVNPGKCLFKQESLWFYGYMLTKDGLQADRKKIAAIQNTYVPQDVTQLRSFLGLANYCARFIPNFSAITAPLRELTKTGVKYVWTPTQQQAFDQVKQAIMADCLMAYYDPQKKTVLTVDASPYGLGAILSNIDQDSTTRHVAYASRSLTEVEQKYSHTEKEALAVVWGCERFHMYLIGTKFDLFTDHKALEVIFSPTSKPPARIERWALRLQQYDFTVKYRKGDGNPADVLSRMPLPTQRQKVNVADEYVNFIAAHSIPKSMTYQEIQSATQADQQLQAVIKASQTGTWPAELQRFHHLRQELTITADNVLLRGNRIIIPQALRPKTLKLAHQGHQGIVKTKQLLRSKVWWPAIDNDAEQLINSCLACQATGLAMPSTPVQMTTLPTHPWKSLRIDFCGPFPTGEMLFAMIDEYSRFPEVEIMKSTTTQSVILCMEKIFATHGIPEKITSDNGPPFHSHEFKDYMQLKGIAHHKVTPLWPQANGLAESFMKPLCKAVRTARIEGRDWRHGLYQFLLNYRCTPHSTTGVSPAELLFNRQLSNGIPTVKHPNSGSSEQHRTAASFDHQRKTKMKEYADRRRRVKEPTIAVGDIVLMQQAKRDKFSTRYEPNPYQVISVKGTQVTAERSGLQRTRHISYFKPYHGSCDQGLAERSSESDEDEDISDPQPPLQPPPAVERRYPVRQRERPRYYVEER